MSQETLNRLRIVIPGVLIFFAFPPLFLETLDFTSLAERFSSVDLLRDSIAVIGLGALYRIFKIRRPALWRSLRRIDGNIKDRLLTPCLSDTVVSAAAAKLLSGRTLMDVFYKFVDRDPTLREKAKRVRFNGLLWTSVADVATIGALGAIAYLITFAFTDYFHHVALALALGLIALVAYFLLMPLVTRHHIALSNEQLDFIDQEFRPEVCADIRRIANGL